MNGIYRTSILSAALALLLSGCAREDANSPGISPTSQVSHETTNAEPAAPVVEEPAYSAAAAGIVRMVQSGMPEINIRNQVILARGAYDLTPDELVRMAADGVPQSLISVILQHDAQIHAEARRLQVARTQAVDNARLRRELNDARLALQRERLAARPAVNPVRNASPPPNIDLPPQASGFYEALKPYGSWVRHGQYGLVWQPTVALSNRRWQPYAHNGRWLETGQGWYWHSEYPWGWAVFHYGRWGFDKNGGWYWVPDTVWGPSWVTFRMNGVHLGWAPLPPGSVAVPNRGMVYNGRNVGVNFSYGVPAAHYSFVPSNLVFARALQARLLAESRRRALFRDTTVINNIIVGNNNTVTNVGPPIDHFTRRAALAVQRGRILPAPSYDLNQFGRFANNTLYRPTLQHIVPVKPAVWNAGGATQTVLIPESAVPNTVIAGRPMVDHSTGVPVVTGYTTEPERRRPAVINNIIIGTNNTVAVGQPVPPSVVTGGVLAPSPALQNARARGFFNQSSPGFTPAMPQSAPVPIMSTPQAVGVGLPAPTSQTNANQGAGFQFNPDTGQYHFNQRR